MDEQTRKETFGNTIKELRLGKNLSLRAVADNAEISHSYLSQVELGKRNIPSPEIVKKIALALEIDYFVLARIAGYLETDGRKNSENAHLEKMHSESDEIFNIIEFKVPAVIKTDSENGESSFTVMSPEESKEKFLDLLFLLNSNENLYFKNKLLNTHERTKIAKLLEIIFDDHEV